MKKFKLIFSLWFFLSLVLAIGGTAGSPAPQMGSVKLAWDWNFTNPVTTFKIYWGIGPVISNWNGTNIVCDCGTNSLAVGVVTNTVITNLIRGQRYYFYATTVVDGGGAEAGSELESLHSNEVIYNVPKKPDSPKALSVSP